MTAALAANFRHSIVTSLLSAIIFSRKVLITDCYRMNRDGYTVCCKCFYNLYDGNVFVFYISESFRVSK
ncbi:hypothetical protein HanRHA438_Chr05g0236551 [Helianthus annuus]|uniref:Uncharacterized protein n=1 Tax=Helianthus annuus TaxID=4232 RepID=A0A9K3NNL0_HELAN|nr:hypothetical protein HanXRQr2_Chr05g0227461 [Helianthus annuus]KAJ0920046.1 hypothetical protein HanRHA438_Chr05g0236551 [Helianthus annuus]